MRDIEKTREQLMNETGEPHQRLVTHSASGFDAEVMDEIGYRAQRLEAIVSAASDGVLEWDMATNWLEWDERLHRLAGTSSESFSHDISELISRIHRDDVAPASAALYAHIEHGAPYRAEFRLRRENGEYVWVLAAGQVVRDEDDKPLKLIASLTGINQNRQSPEALRESESRYRILFDSLCEAVFVAEPGGRIIEANLRLCEISGYQQAELLQMNVLGLMTPGQAVRWLTLVGQVTEEGDARAEASIYRKDGTELPVELDCACLPDGNIIASMRDTVDRQILGCFYSQAQVMEGFERFARGLAHELNNMLTPVLGYAQLSERALEEPDKVMGYLKEIQNSADRAASLTGQLLAFARRQVMHPEVTSLNDLIVRMDAMLRHVLGEGIEMEARCATDLWAVRVDTRHIEQALINFVRNARDAMPFGGKLTISMVNTILGEDYSRQHSGIIPGEYVALSITDTGIGMTEDVRLHVMEPFFTTKRPGEGPGLGLAACYGIVAQNEGHIEVLSEPGQGSTFKIFFPRVVPSN